MVYACIASRTGLTLTSNLTLPQLHGTVCLDHNPSQRWHASILGQGIRLIATTGVKNGVVDSMKVSLVKSS